MTTPHHPRSLLTECYNSAEIRRHYYDVRAQAAAFLFTVGAKALVLEEQKCSTEMMHEGINDEAEIRAKMVNEERIRSIRRKIMSKIALSVLKRGRDEKVRTVNIVLHHDKKKGTYLSWRSKLNYSKRFEIPSGTIVSKLALIENSHQQPASSATPNASSSSSSKPASSSNNHNGTLSNTRSNSKRGSTTFEIVDISKTEFHIKYKIKEQYPSASFLRLTNAARSLDLSFQSPLELEAFLFILQKQVGVHVKPEVLAVTAAATNSIINTNTTNTTSNNR